MIDGRTNAVTHVGGGLISVNVPHDLAVDEQRNKIYVGEWTTRVTIIDGATNTLCSVPNPGNYTFKIVANPLANEFYTLNIASMAGNYPPKQRVCVRGALSKERGGMSRNPRSD